MNPLFKVGPEIKPPGGVLCKLFSKLNAAGQDIRGITQILNSLLKTAGFFQIIIRVEKEQVISGCPGSALVHGIGNALIGFRDKTINFFPVSIDDVNRSVSRCTVHNDVFNIFIGLTEHTLDGLLNMGFSIQ